VPRQADVDREAVMSRFHQKQVDMEKVAFRQRFEEQERCQRQLQEQRLKLIRQFKQQQLRNSETLAKIQSVRLFCSRYIGLLYHFRCRPNNMELVHWLFAHQGHSLLYEMHQPSVPIDILLYNGCGHKGLVLLLCHDMTW